MFDEVRYQEAVKNAAHYLAIGQKEIHLWGRGDERPWDAVISVEPGGSHRLDITTSVNFKAKKAGLTFSWSFDIEKREADGHGYYALDTDGIGRVAAKLNGEAKQQFLQYLDGCADAIEKKAKEYADLASSQYGEAALIRRLAKG